MQDGIDRYIGPQIGQEFFPGTYRAEVFFVEVPVRSLAFRIVDPE